jgi:hypothetical protein
MVLLAGCSSLPANRPDDAASLAVAEVGSFHTGGRTVTLQGLPIKEIRFTPTSPLTRLDPNGEFEVEQMSQYVKLTPQARRAPYPLLAWRRTQWCHLGNQAGRPAWLANVLSQGRARRLCF